MRGLSVQDLIEASQTLDDMGITAVVTGDIGLNYHGVDAVTFSLELCVPACQRDEAIEALTTATTKYHRLPDITKPDLCHQYKQDAACFVILATKPIYELHLITDAALGLDLSTPDCTETGATLAKIHPELRDFVRDTDDASLSKLHWLNFATYLNIWLRRAQEVRGQEREIFDLMEAERLIDGGGVDDAWLERDVQDEENVLIAKKLLKGQVSRKHPYQWD